MDHYDLLTEKILFSIIEQGKRDPERVSKLNAQVILFDFNDLISTIKNELKAENASAHLPFALENAVLKKLQLPEVLQKWIPFDPNAGPTAPSRGLGNN